MSERDLENDHRLRAAASQFAEAIERCNQPLPGDFPTAALLQTARNLAALGNAEGPGARQVLAHAQAKLREARLFIRSDPDDQEAPSYYEVERALAALFVEIDAQLEGVPRQELLALYPPKEGVQVVARRGDLESKVAALEKRIDAVGAAVASAGDQIGQSSSTSLLNMSLNIRDVEINLDAIAKFSGQLKAEIAGTDIDLAWVSHLVAGVKHLTDGLGKAAEAIRRAGDEFSGLAAGLERVRHFSRRVVSGGRALLRAVNRMLRRSMTSAIQDEGGVFKKEEQHFTVDAYIWWGGGAVATEVEQLVQRHNLRLDDSGIVYSPSGSRSGVLLTGKTTASVWHGFLRDLASQSWVIHLHTGYGHYQLW